MLLPERKEPPSATGKLFTISNTAALNYSHYSTCHGYRHDDNHLRVDAILTIDTRYRHGQYNQQ